MSRLPTRTKSQFVFMISTWLGRGVRSKAPCHGLLPCHGCQHLHFILVVDMANVFSKGSPFENWVRMFSLKIWKTQTYFPLFFNFNIGNLSGYISITLRNQGALCFLANSLKVIMFFYDILQIYHKGSIFVFTHINVVSWYVLMEINVVLK